MSLAFDTMDVTRTNIQRQLTFVADCVHIQNNTPYPLYVNLRGNNPPTLTMYDKRVYAGGEAVYPSESDAFAFFLDIGGTSIPAVGALVTISYQADKVIPSFSQSNYRSVRAIAYTVTLASPQVIYDIDASGSAGLLLSINNTTGKVQVLVQVSPDNSFFYGIDVFTISAGDNATRVYPVTAPFFKISVIVYNAYAPATGIFSYSLSNTFEPIAEQLQSVATRTFTATMSDGNIPLFLTSNHKYLDQLDIYFEVASPTSTFRIDITVTIDNDLQFIYILMSDPPINLATAINIGIASPLLIHRRLSEYGYHIQFPPIVGKFLVSATLTNNSGASISNVNTLAIERRAV